jgi:hypothetical protein
LNKILVTIQGKTLIVYYRIRSGLSHNNTRSASYIEVLPNADLAKCNLQGLTPEMFCVNIADMVNIRGLYTGTVENERQLAVAKWSLNYDEYLHLKNTAAPPLSHAQLAVLLSSMPGYVRTADEHYIEFEASVIPHSAAQNSYSGYRLSLMTEEIAEQITTRAYYYLDTHTASGWQDTPPLAQERAAIQAAVQQKLQEIRDVGVQLASVRDETDYAPREQP